MLIVISNPTQVAQETELMNRLLDEGLEVLHLRKPGYDVQEMEKLLRQINSDHYPRIALHQHHALGEKFGLCRFHFSVASREEQGKAIGERAKEKRVFSTSIHSQQEYAELPAYFAYTFFGPVYASLSKPGYGPVNQEEGRLPQVAERKTKIIALGGIAETNLEKTLAMGYHGVAVLGAIWQNPAKAVQKFKLLQRLCKRTDLSC